MPLTQTWTISKGGKCPLPHRHGQGGTCPLWKCCKVFCALQSAQYTNYLCVIFSNMSSASGGFTPRPRLHPWTRLGTIVPRPLIGPPQEKNPAGPLRSPFGVTHPLHGHLRSVTISMGPFYPMMGPFTPPPCTGRGIRGWSVSSLLTPIPRDAIGLSLYLVLSIEISIKLVTSNQHMSSHCCKGFKVRGQRSRSARSRNFFSRDTISPYTYWRNFNKTCNKLTQRE